jgi:hypothetical protein
MHQQSAQGGVELHLTGRVRVRSHFHRGERLLNAAAAFLQQRQVHL